MFVWAIIMIMITLGRTIQTRSSENVVNLHCIVLFIMTFQKDGSEHGRVFQ